MLVALIYRGALRLTYSFGRSKHIAYNNQRRLKSCLFLFSPFPTWLLVVTTEALYVAPNNTCCSMYSLAVADLCFILQILSRNKTWRKKQICSIFRMKLTLSGVDAFIWSVVIQGHTYLINWIYKKKTLKQFNIMR